MSSKVNVFISYAQKDDRLLKNLDRHLSGLKQQNYIDVWYHRNISAGRDWKREISQHLDSSQVILLLVSPDFVNSDYCYSVEMKRAMEKHKLGESVVVPIILRPTDWQTEPFNKLRALPKDAKPVTLWHNRDTAFLDIARGIRKVVDELTTKHTGNFTTTFIDDVENVNPPIQLRPSKSLPSASEEIEAVRSPSQVQLPEPIRKYLESYPMFDLPQDIMNSFIRTSAESFYLACRLIHESLTPGQVIWVTDNLNFSSSTQGWFTQYWVGEGLEHLRINHEAANRGIKINRFFFVTTAEYTYFRRAIDEIGILHAKAGVTPHVVLYERVPPHCRYGLAIWGDMYSDEVVYDIRSNSVIDNFIHWSSYKVKQFIQKIAIIRNLVEPDWSVTAQKEDDFQEVLRHAMIIRKQLKALDNSSDV